MEPEGSLPHSQVPATCPYPEPARSSPYPHIPFSEGPSSLLRSYQSVSPDPRLCLSILRSKILFNREELLAPRPTPKLEDRPLSTVQDLLFNILAATIHIGGRSSIRNLRTRHTLVTGTHFSHEVYIHIHNVPKNINIYIDNIS